jgi:hypothetical protein
MTPDTKTTQSDPSLDQSSGKVQSALFRDGWRGDLLKARVRAMIIHAVICSSLMLCLTVPLVLWLYPNPFYKASGVMSLMSIVVGVDIVLGPLLTFLVFDQRKKSLRLDLTVIVVIQALALVYGMYAAVIGRPVFMTFVADRFEVIYAAQVDVQELAKAPDSYKKLAWGQPMLAYAQLPTSKDERSAVLMSSVQNGADLGVYIRYYKPLPEAKDKILQKARSVQDLKKFNDPTLVDRLLNERPGGQAEFKFLPLVGRDRAMTVLVDPVTAAVVKVVDLKPWE